jgi:hypothetical protein
MFSDYALRSFEHYIATCPKALLGVWPLTPQGAYDAVGGARAHGFGQRRGIPYSAFSRGGKFAFDAELENGELSETGKSWKAIEAFLQPLLGDTEFQECSKLIEDLVDNCTKDTRAEKAKDDDPDDAEAMDRRRARDNPPPFANGGRPNPGGRVDPADPKMAGRAGDARPRRVSQSAADSFSTLFPNASTVKHV